MQHNNSHKAYQFPENATVAVYVRQSVQQQHIQGTSNIQQTDLLRDAAVTMGIADDHIVVINDAPSSAEHPQPGMQALIDQIIGGDIQAVFVPHEKALFTDGHQIDVATFTKLCQEHHILLCTPHAVYDMTDSYDTHQFRFQTEQAHAYIQEYVRSHLHRTKDQAAKRGFYDGRKLPPGYIVNRQRTTTEDANGTYKKMVPYAPHAAVVRSIFQQYVECNGRANELYAFLQNTPVLFPEFDESVDQRNRSRTTLKKVPGGYHLSLVVLKQMVSGNEVYIGTWTYKEVTIPRNHPGIIPEELFWQAKELFVQHQHHTGKQQGDE